MGQWAAHFVHDPRAALHEDLWPGARATGDGLGRAARMGGEDEVDPLLREVAGTRGRDLDQCVAAVGHQATLSQPERVGDHPRVQHPRR
jgi:hypothetical protein